MSRFLRRLTGPEPDDIQPTDWVRRIGLKGVGVVQSIDNGNALVAFFQGKREIIPVGHLRRVRQRGGYYDTRAGE